MAKALQEQQCSSCVTAEFASNFWSELLIPKHVHISRKTKHNNNMDTGICVWFYQEVFTGTEINLHSANQYTVNCYLHSKKKNTAK